MYVTRNTSIMCMLLGILGIMCMSLGTMCMLLGIVYISRCCVHY